MKDDPLRSYPKPPPRQKKGRGFKKPQGYTDCSTSCYDGLERKSTLKPRGKRYERNAAGIAKAQAHFHSLPCVCGRCGMEDGNQWCHLDGRSEDVLLDYTLAVPG